MVKKKIEKLYVAANYEHDRGLAAIFAKHFESIGYKITRRWWSEEEDESKEESALGDVQGVIDADAVVVIMLQTRGWKGTWCEIGMAIALGKPVYFVGDAGDSCIFRAHPLCQSYYASELHKEMKEAAANAAV